jgi:hypothetical protein
MSIEFSTFWKYKSDRGDYLDPRSTIFHCDKMIEKTNINSTEIDEISLECAITSKQTVFTRVFRFDIKIEKTETNLKVSVTGTELAEFFNPIGYELQRI